MNIRDNNDNHAWRYKRIEEYGNLTGSLRLQRWLFIALTILFGSLIVINTFTIQRFRNVPILENTISFSTRSTPAPTTGYLVHTKGCRIPALDPLDPDIIQRFIKSDERITCDSSYLPRLVESNDTAIFVNRTSKGYYYHDYEDVECCWSSFWRTEDRDNDVAYEVFFRDTK